MSKQFWNERYKAVESVYGNEPNVFFKEQLDKLQPGLLLLPAEGEGRNALYAAAKGWQVDAFDFSEEAREKALRKATALNLSIVYSHEDIQTVKLPDATYDIIALIYVHLPPDLRQAFHQQCIDALKPGGVLILEAFTKEQLHNTSGGPKDSAMLYSLPDITADFSGLHVLQATEEIVQLNEGDYHRGKADLLRLVGKSTRNFSQDSKM